MRAFAALMSAADSLRIIFFNDFFDLAVPPRAARVNHL